MQIGTETEVVVLISNKIDFNAKNLQRTKKDNICYKRVNAARRYNIVSIYTPKDRLLKYRKPIDRVEGRNRKFHNNRWKLKYSALNI